MSSLDNLKVPYNKQVSMSRSIDGSGHLESFPDIHRVSDGKLFKYGITTRYSPDDKRKIILSLKDLVAERANPEIQKFGIIGLQLIAQDAGAAPNWQGADQLFADDILVEICHLISLCNDDEVINTAVNHLSEQMSDMIRTSGTCPSGRVNRCIQVYMVLRDAYDGKHLPPS